MADLPEWNEIIREATQQVEELLSIEDKGWINMSTTSQEIIPAQNRRAIIQEIRTYALTDPLAARSIALMTDYTFGTGINWNIKNEKAKSLLENFWYLPGNKPLLASKGLRKSSIKLLVDGEIFLAVFLGSKGEATIRRIDPLEITSFLTDPDDMENVRYYKREWADTQSKQHTDYYRSFANIKDEGCTDSLRVEHKKTQDALVYHLAINDFFQRGNSYLLPALDWIKLYRKFLAARAAVMLAVARFAWKVKVQGGSAAVADVKSTYHEEEIKAGSTSIENMGADLQPIKTDSGASQAYQDGRQLKLQVSAATGWPEQYFGDISIGNLATAKTVELPVQKMCESYQSIWSDTYDDIFQLILSQNNIKGDDAYVDIDFPGITPEDASQIADSLMKLMPIFPSLADSDDVLQQALMSIGIKDTNAVLEQMTKESKSGNATVNLVTALRELKEELKHEVLRV